MIIVCGLFPTPTAIAHGAETNNRLKTRTDELALVEALGGSPLHQRSFLSLIWSNTRFIRFWIVLEIRGRTFLDVSQLILLFLSCTLLVTPFYLFRSISTFPHNPSPQAASLSWQQSMELTNQDNTTTTSSLAEVASVLSGVGITNQAQISIQVITVMDATVVCLESPCGQVCDLGMGYRG